MKSEFPLHSSCHPMITPSKIAMLYTGINDSKTNIPTNQNFAMKNTCNLIGRGLIFRISSYTQL